MLSAGSSNADSMVCGISPWVPVAWLGGFESGGVAGEGEGRLLPLGTVVAVTIPRGIEGAREEKKIEHHISSVLLLKIDHHNIKWDASI